MARTPSSRDDELVRLLFAPGFSPREVSDALGLLALAMGPDSPVAALPALRVLQQSIAATVPPHVPEAQRLERYFQLHPLPPRLLQGLRALCDDAAALSPAPSALPPPNLKRILGG